MRKLYKVPVAQFRPGAVIEFTPTSPSRATHGTIKHLISLGPRHTIAVLSRKVECDGTIVTEGDREYHVPLIYDISHASRVLHHGTGAVKFEQGVKPALLQEVDRVRATTSYARKGKRIVLTWGLYSPQAALRLLVAEYMSRNGGRLGIQPWEYFDEFAFMESLEQVGIVKKSEGNATFSLRLDVRTDKLVRYLRQNVNRFKRNLDALDRQRQKDDKEALKHGEVDFDVYSESDLEDYEEAPAC